MGSNFGLDMDWVRREAQRIQAGVGPGAGGGKNLRDFVNYDWRDGQNILRLFPPSKQPGSSFLAKLVFQHHRIGPEKETCLCYENTYPDSRFQCPVCQVIKELTNAGIDAWSHGSRGRAVTNGIDRFDEAKGPQIVRMPLSVYNWIIQQVATQNIDVTNPYNGADLIITKTGKQLNTDYSSSFRIVNGQVACAAGTPEQIEQWLGMLFDMNAFNKNKDWNSDDGKTEYARLITLAGYLRRQFMGDTATVVPAPTPGGFTPPAPGPVVPAAPPAPSTPPPPVAAASVPPPPPPVGNVVTASATLSPVAPPPPIAPTAAPAPPPPVAPVAAPPPPPVAAPAPPADTPPWQAPPAPPVAAPAPPAAAPVAPPQAPAPPPPAAVSATPAPTVTSTSSDSKPPCFGKASNDQTVEFGGLKGGYQNGEYRCMMCSHEMQCSAVAIKAFPDLYPGIGAS